jgi:hypothetical protein
MYEETQPHFVPDKVLPKGGAPQGTAIKRLCVVRCFFHFTFLGPIINVSVYVGKSAYHCFVSSYILQIICSVSIL